MIVDQIIKFYAAATNTLGLRGGLTLNGPLQGATTVNGTLTRPVYGPTIAINAALGNIFVITITDGVAFAIAAPTNPTTGQNIRLNVVNASGGAAGVGTFNAAYKMTSNTLAAIANGENRTVDFFYNGTNWIQTTYSADVPN